MHIAFEVLAIIMTKILIIRSHRVKFKQPYSTEYRLYTFDGFIFVLYFYGLCLYRICICMDLIYLIDLMYLMYYLIDLMYLIYLLDFTYL